MESDQILFGGMILAVFVLILSTPPQVKQDINHDNQIQCVQIDEHPDRLKCFNDDESCFTIFTKHKDSWKWTEEVCNGRV